MKRLSAKQKKKVDVPFDLLCLWCKKPATKSTSLRHINNQVLARMFCSIAFSSVSGGVPSYLVTNVLLQHDVWVRTRTFAFQCLESG